MITRTEIKAWWKKNWKYVCAAGAGAVVGGLCISKCVDSRIGLKEAAIDKTLQDARKALNDISSRVDTTVKKVYETEAKKAFEAKLNDMATSDEIVNIARRCVKTETNDILRKAVDKAVTTETVNGALENYLAENSIFVKRKVVEAIHDQIDDKFASELMEVIEEAIDDAI